MAAQCLTEKKSVGGGLEGYSSCQWVKASYGTRTDLFGSIRINGIAQQMSNYAKLNYANAGGWLTGSGKGLKGWDSDQTRRTSWGSLNCESGYSFHYRGVPLSPSCRSMTKVDQRKWLVINKKTRTKETEHRWAHICPPPEGAVYDKHRSQDVESGKTTDPDGAAKGNIVTARRRSAKTRPVRVLIRRIAAMSAVLAVLVGLGAAVWYFLGWVSVVQLILVAVVAYIAAGHYKWLYVALRTAPRDIW
ncbi:hypothetical protein NQ318_020215 [Aromia moschata]|uniref:Uncharacterized protein n=1 Tax=Aromia moschata TaxID=1265417 RepID=A0AAV8ZBE7_9CUCU|nr:hypothetical protein NQ318_020215 [Aromia moschata]